jgi:hypothetical protein
MTPPQKKKEQRKIKGIARVLKLTADRKVYLPGVGGEDNSARLLEGPGKRSDAFNAQRNHLIHSRVLNKNVII